MSEGLHSGVHPDPDALNAFVEGALPEHEHVECLAHLAECAQCREVVFLAQKAAEIEEPVAVPEAPVSFWQGFLRPMTIVPAAALLALISFGVYRTIRSVEPQPEVTASTKAPVETPPAAPAPAAKVEEQTPRLQPAPRSVSRPAVPGKQEQPPVETAPSVVAAAPPLSPPPAPVLTADTGGVVQLAEKAGAVGAITDPAGAVIASARVELKNEDTGVTYTSTSDARGEYSIAGLAPGRYDFSVTVPGFKKFLWAGITVQPQQITRLDSALQVGAASESVTVTAEASLLKTEGGELSGQPGLASLSELPLLTRASPVYTLPDKSTPVSVATKDKLVVAVDSAGALLISENAGKNWTRVKATWKGKAVRVALTAASTFELTVDPASTWVSTDGRHWSKAHASR